MPGIFSPVMDWRRPSWINKDFHQTEWVSPSHSNTVYLCTDYAGGKCDYFSHAEVHFSQVGPLDWRCQPMTVLKMLIILFSWSLCPMRFTAMWKQKCWYIRKWPLSPLVVDPLPTGDAGSEWISLKYGLGINASS